MPARVSAPARLDGEVRVPGDKSISHRALILNAIAEGQASLSGLSAGADVMSSASCLRALGVRVSPDRVEGAGLLGLREAAGALDCGNSGTTMRLLAGLLAGQGFRSTLTGDESLSRRPMGRVVAPLRLMGAFAEESPLRVGGHRPLRGIRYESPVASAQVKSALLLAGLYAEGETEVVEPAPSRDHTELMLRAMGADLETSGPSVRLRPTRPLAALSLAVPGDLSSAAFWLVAGALHPSARISLPGIGVNPTRAGILDAMDRAGLPVRLAQPRLEGREPVADLVVESSSAGRSFSVGAGEVAALVDELPILAVAAAVLPGTSRISGAAELRVKESDRIDAMAEGLARMGADVESQADGWVIRGPGRLRGAEVRSFGDHRVAMALAVAGLLAEGETVIEGSECVDISYPGFWADLARLGGDRATPGG